MAILSGLGIILCVGAYLAGLRRWIYAGRLLEGLGAILIVFPVLILLTKTAPALYLRGIPLVGVAMFAHRYGRRILMQIKLLWFTTLSVLVVQGYYLLIAFRAGN